MSFDPAEFGELVRSGELYPPTPDELPNYGETGCWQAGSGALQLTLQCWWAAEEEAAHDVFTLANIWLAAPTEKGKPWGQPAIFHEAIHRQAQAVAAWARGKDEPAAWRLAANTIDQWLETDEADDPEAWIFQSELCRWLSGTKPEPVSLSGAQGKLIHDLGLGQDDATAFMRYLNSTSDAHFNMTGSFAQAIVQIAAFYYVGKIEHPPLCLQALFVLAPRVALPPGLEERGWSDSKTDSLEMQGQHFTALKGMLQVIGLLADDVGDNSANGSMQNAEGLELEIMPTDTQLTRLRLAGPGAGRLCGLARDMLNTLT